MCVGQSTHAFHCVCLLVFHVFGSEHCDISSTLTLHTTHLHFANSPRLTLQLFSLSFPFSPLTFPVSLSLIIIVVLPLLFMSKLPEFLVASVWAVAQNANGAVFASLWGDKDKRWTEKINNRLGRSEYKQINMTALSRCARGLGDVYWENQAGGRQQQLKFAKHCSRNGPFAHWKGFKSSLTQQEEERSANV